MLGCRLEPVDVEEQDVDMDDQDVDVNSHEDTSAQSLGDKNSESGGECGLPQSMKKLAETHRLVMTSHRDVSNVGEELYHCPMDGVPLAALTQVMFQAPSMSILCVMMTMMLCYCPLVVLESE